MTDTRKYLGALTEAYCDHEETFVEPRLQTSPRVTGVQVRSPAVARYLQLSHELVLPAAGIAPRREVVETLEELGETVLALRRLLLTAAPGGGKTTTLERLALHFAKAALADERQPVPVLMQLGSCQPQAFDRDRQAALEETGLTGADGREPVWLLDALNEATPSVKAAVREWLADDREVMCVVASRLEDLDAEQLRLPRLEIAPLDVFRIRELLDRCFEPVPAEGLFWDLAGPDALQAWTWYLAHDLNASFKHFWDGPPITARSVDVFAGWINEMRVRLADHNELPGLLGLVTNPYLLNLSMRAFASSGRLPENRVDLFDQFTTMMIEERGRAGATPFRPWIDRADQEEALSVLAYKMQQAHLGTAVSIPTAEALLAVCAGHPPSSYLSFGLASSILARTGENKVRFRHQLLQEYFAARRLLVEVTRGLSSSALFRDDQWWEPTAWDETVRFAACMAGDATEIVQWLSITKPSLAFSCLQQAGVSCSPEVQKLLLDPPAGQRACPRARRLWGRQLADSPHGDTRPGVGCNEVGPQPRWELIPAGDFVFGDDEELIGMHDQPPAGLVTLDYDYFLSRYPVTVQQFRVFVEVGGYSDREFWTDEGWEWKGTELCPHGYCSWPRSSDNCPVANVTWYEAVAYAQWLDAVGDKPGQLPASWHIRLPTEAEWEKAARFPDGRMYPWGDTYRSGYANVDETAEDCSSGPYYLGGVTAVGLYEAGRSDFGLHDLAGNVWEWLLSEWAVPYRYPENNAVDGRVFFRGVRGGSWINNARFARSTYRDHLDPDLTFADIGFRLALGPEPLGT